MLQEMDSASKLKKYNIAKELIWWVISILLAYIVLDPICSKIDYKYLYFNILIVLVPIHYFRYIIFFRSNLFLKYKWVRFFVFALNIQIIIHMVRVTQDILVVVEEQNIQAVMHASSSMKMGLNEIFHLLRYMKEEMLGFTIASSLTAVALNLRIIYAFFGFGSNSMKNMLGNSQNK